MASKFSRNRDTGKLYDRDAMSDRYAVIGNPVGHSKSPLIHASFALACAQDISYSTIEPPVTGFANAVREFRASGAHGMNVTTPFKLEAFSLADRCSERARLAGAANALKFESGTTHAENFDGIGLVTDIQRNLHVPIAGKRVLILGAGGATRGVLLPMLRERPAEVVIVNRSVCKALALARQYAEHGAVRGSAYSGVANQSFDLIINASSASLTDELPPVVATVFAATSLAYDLAYGRGLTPFLRLAEHAAAARIADGIGMLVEQAAETFRWWRGMRPETRSVIDNLKDEGGR